MGQVDDDQFDFGMGFRMKKDLGQCTVRSAQECALHQNQRSQTQRGTEPKTEGFAESTGEVLASGRTLRSRTADFRSQVARPGHTNIRRGRSYGGWAGGGCIPRGILIWHHFSFQTPGSQPVLRPTSLRLLLLFSLVHSARTVHEIIAEDKSILESVNCELGTHTHLGTG